MIQEAKSNRRGRHVLPYPRGEVGRTVNCRVERVEGLTAFFYDVHGNLNRKTAERQGPIAALRPSRGKAVRFEI